MFVGSDCDKVLKYYKSLKIPQDYDIKTNFIGAGIDVDGSMSAKPKWNSKVAHSA